MEELTRIGVAIGSDLLARFDRFIAKQGYTNRSEALRDLMRDRTPRHELAEVLPLEIGLDYLQLSPTICNFPIVLLYWGPVAGSPFRFLNDDEKGTRCESGTAPQR